MSPTPPSAGDNHGPVIGTDPDTETAIQLDRFNPERNGPHTFVVGDSGTGKTHDTKLDVYRALATYSDLEVVLFDSFGNYEQLTELNYASTSINAGEAPHNPFAIHTETLTEDQFEHAISNAVTYLCSVLREYDVTIDPDTKDLLREMVRETYRNHDIQPESTTFARAEPTLGEILSFSETLQKQSSTGQLDTIIEPLDKYWRANKVAHNTSGLACLGQHSVIQIEIPQVEPSQYLAYLNEVLQYSEATENRVLVVFDEARPLFADGCAARLSQYLQSNMKRAHHTDTSFHMVLQQPDTLLEAFDPAWVRNHIGYTRVYNVGAAPKAAKLLGFPAECFSFIDTYPGEEEESRSVAVLYSPDGVEPVPVCTSRNATETLELFA